MKVIKVAVTYDKKIQLKRYEPLGVAIYMEAVVEEGESPSEVIADLHWRAKTQWTSLINRDMEEL